MHRALGALLHKLNVGTIREALSAAAVSLQALPQSSPDLEAAVLLCYLLGKPRSYLYTWPDASLTPQQTSDYQHLIERRLQGEPIAHITGEREFWSLNLKITPDTLIPRPETEQLVERALELLQGIPRPVIADLGTGSGTIALAIASECPNCRVDATDASPAALAVARENARSLRLKNVLFHQGDWLAALPPEITFDLILSNPPYIEEEDPHLMQGDLPREPRSALASGADGLDDIRLIAAQAPARLKQNGWLLLEHGYSQGKAVRNLLQQNGFTQCRTLPDLAGHERLSEGQWVVNEKSYES